MADSLLAIMMGGAQTRIRRLVSTSFAPPLAESVVSRTSRASKLLGLFGKARKFEMTLACMHARALIPGQSIRLPPADVHPLCSAGGQIHLRYLVARNTASPHTTIPSEYCSLDVCHSGYIACRGHAHTRSLVRSRMLPTNLFTEKKWTVPYTD